MLKFLPLLLSVAYGLLMWRFSAWRTGKELEEKSHLLKDDPALLSEIQKIATALELPKVDVHIYEVALINGLAFSDGRIFLTRGFLDQKAAGVVSNEELASVVAHELGHVALGHSKRRMIDFTGHNAIFVILSGILARFIPRIGPLIARTATTALMARLSRRDEFEADAYASAVLVKSKIGTSHQKSLLKKLDRLGSTTQSPPSWFMSHPKTADRIRAIEENEQKWGIT